MIVKYNDTSTRVYIIFKIVESYHRATNSIHTTKSIFLNEVAQYNYIELYRLTKYKSLEEMTLFIKLKAYSIINHNIWVFPQTGK